MEKTELLEALEDDRQEFIELLEGLSEEMLLEPGVIGNWSVKDILNHLTFWEGQTVTMLFQARQGAPKPGTVHFGKESVDTVNQRWYTTGLERPLDTVWADWLGVRKQMIRRVDEFSEQELNDPNLYGWLDDRPLVEWILTDSIEHEAEHVDEIRAWLDARDSDG